MAKKREAKIGPEIVVSDSIESSEAFYVTGSSDDAATNLEGLPSFELAQTKGDRLDALVREREEEDKLASDEETKEVDPTPEINTEPEIEPSPVLETKPSPVPTPKPSFDQTDTLNHLAIIATLGNSTVPQFRSAAGLGPDAIVYLRQYETRGLVKRDFIAGRGIWSITAQGQSLVAK